MNRRSIFAVLALVAVAALAALAYRIGMNQGMSMVSEGARPTALIAGSAPMTSPGEANAGERKVLYWHDPMVPGHRFDQPGKSPFMDMQLVPVYADKAQGSGVAVSPAMTQSLGVRTAVVRRGPIGTAFDTVGTVVLNERATSVVQVRATGYVERLFVRATLDPVVRGQPLATIFVPEWAGALDEYLALRRANLDPVLVTAARERLRLLAIPDEIVERSVHDGTAQSRFTLHAPSSGVVTELGVREGATAQPGMVLFRITDLSSVWIDVAVPEAQAGQVRAGARTSIRSDAYPGRSFAGKVGAVLPQVDTQTRTLRARVELPNPGGVLKPGMFVSVALAPASTQDALLVPQEAVIATGRRNVVLVATDTGRFVPVEVALGRATADAIEVRAGLSMGQRVVTSGQFLIDSEASLKSMIGRLEAGAGPSASPGGPRSDAGPVVSQAGPQGASYRTRGRLEAIDRDEWMLSHDPIPALTWPSMTMGFKPPASGLPTGLAAGDAVEFEFVARDGSYQVTRIERVGRAGAKP